MKENKIDFNKGFTLAEVLITLTIIGVIAALTIPNLLQSYKKHQYVVSLQKAYSTLQNLIKMIPITENCPAGDLECAGFFDSNDIDGQTFGNSNSKKRIYLFSKNLKGSTVCYDKKGANCLWFSKVADSISNAPRILTADGIVFSFHEGNYAIHTDINSTQEPNLRGRDYFIFNLATEEKNGVHIGTIMPEGSKIDAKYQNRGDWHTYCPQWRGNNATFDSFCTGRVLEKGKMDY